jgi:hypothetical protein
MENFKILSCLTLLLAGCATTYPVVAVLEGNDRFFGTAKSVAVGESSFSMSNADGVTCEGNYTAELVWTMTQGASTNGDFSCSDGRIGRYATTGTASGGQGEGKLSNGSKLKIYYGQFASFQQLN